MIKVKSIYQGERGGEERGEGEGKEEIAQAADISMNSTALGQRGKGGGREENIRADQIGVRIPSRRGEEGKGEGGRCWSTPS